jgi:hypothetical protein
MPTDRARKVVNYDKQAASDGLARVIDFQICVAENITTVQVQRRISNTWYRAQHH